jgi:hypothetical protein
MRCLVLVLGIYKAARACARKIAAFLLNFRHCKINAIVGASALVALQFLQ